MFTIVKLHQFYDNQNFIPIRDVPKTSLFFSITCLQIIIKVKMRQPKQYKTCKSEYFNDSIL